MLEQSLITSEKFLKRHTAAGNAPLPQDWKNLLDYLADADVYWEFKKEKSTLLFLKKLSDLQYLKIAVDVMAKERFLRLPKIDSMYYLNMEGDSGIDEYKRLLEESHPGAAIKEFERFEFYEQAKDAYLLIQTGESALYGNIILKKGVL